MVLREEEVATVMRGDEVAEEGYGRGGCGGEGGEEADGRSW